MRTTLHVHLLDHPGLYLGEMVTYLRQVFEVQLSSEMVCRELVSKGPGHECLCLDLLRVSIL